MAKRKIKSRWRDKAAKRRERQRRKDLAVTEKAFKTLNKLDDETMKEELKQPLTRSLLAQIIYLVDPFDVAL